MTSAEARARRYHRRQLLLTAADLALTTGLLAAWAASGTARALAGDPGPGAWARAAAVARVSLALGASVALLTFPLDVVAGFLLPRRAGLLSQRLGSWLLDRAKLAALAGGFTLLAAEVAYALLAWSPAAWWAWAAAAQVVASLLVTAILPLWIAPLFYRLAPLEDPALRARLLSLARRVGVVAAEVVVADVSRKARVANAAVVGLGPTRRLALSDTLLHAFSADEVEVVLAHELAHHARGHVAQSLAVHGVLALVALWLADRALGAGAAALGLEGPADPAGLPVLALVLGAVGLAAAPLAAAWSRRLEREADRVALEVTRAPVAFASAMERLAELNLGERRPGWLRRLLGSHPPIDERIALARAADTASASRPGGEAPAAG